MLRLKQRKAFLESRIVENKAWAANYDEKFGPFVNKYKEFMEQVGESVCLWPKTGCMILMLAGAVEQMSVLYQNAKDKHANGLQMLMKHFDYHPEFKRWSDTFTAVPFRPK